jgi:hypothetical protein
MPCLPPQKFAINLRKVLISFFIILAPGVSLGARPLDKEEIQNFLSGFEKIFRADLLEKELTLQIEIKTADSNFNAFAEKQSNKAILNISAGVFSHPQINFNLLGLVLCHELGHFLGGPPLSGWEKWSSAEGQADYFASLICMPKLYKQHLIDGYKSTSPDSNQLTQLKQLAQLTRSEKLSNLTHFSSLKLISDLEIFCQKNKVADIFACATSILAGIELTTILAEVRKQEAPSWDIVNPSSLVTLRGEPSLSCRMQCFRHGAISAPRPSCWFINTIDTLF